MMCGFGGSRDEHARLAGHRHGPEHVVFEMASGTEPDLVPIRCPGQTGGRCPASRQCRLLAGSIDHDDARRRVEHFEQREPLSVRRHAQRRNPSGGEIVDLCADGELDLPVAPRDGEIRRPRNPIRHAYTLVQFLRCASREGHTFQGWGGSGHGSQDECDFLGTNASSPDGERLTSLTFATSRGRDSAIARPRHEQVIRLPLPRGAIHDGLAVGRKAGGADGACAEGNRSERRIWNPTREETETQQHRDRNKPAGKRADRCARDACDPTAPRVLALALVAIAAVEAFLGDPPQLGGEVPRSLPSRLRILGQTSVNDAIEQRWCRRGTMSRLRAGRA